MSLPLTRHLRAHRHSVLRAADAALEGGVWRSSTVIDPLTGHLVAPFSPAPDPRLLDELTLFIPDEGDDAAQVHASISWIDDPAFHAMGDRWMAYHGVRPPGRLARLIPRGFRFRGRVYDVEQVDLRNVLASDEPRLVRTANADRARLARAAARAAAGDIVDPLCVGVDALGIDVRTRLGVQRVEFPREAPTTDRALLALEELLTA
ncbi:MAG: hypothetical protein AB7K52_02965 [Phycisphaerales bacterium]